jgi:hypothetical protein
MKQKERGVLMRSPKKVLEFVVYLVVLIGIIVYLIVAKIDKPIKMDRHSIQTIEKAENIERVQ